MKITYFFRNPKAGYSIAKVFQCLIYETRKTNQVELLYVPRHRAKLVSILENIYFVFNHRNKDGVNHITGEIHYCIIALLGCKSVLTIHDLSALNCAKNPLKKSLIKLLWFKLPLLIADKVVCISEHTKKELSMLTNRNDIEVIYNAVDPIFLFQEKQFNEKEPVILQIGTAWNKNIINIIKALSTIPCHFRIIGSLNENIINYLSANRINYSANTGLSDQEIAEEYKKCDIVSFCSIYEGFGMPIIEGNATGRCVITSSISPLNEISNNAALQVDPYDKLSIEMGFRQIINDSNLRNQLIVNGLNNIKRFQPIDISKKYMKIYSPLN